MLLFAFIFFFFNDTAPTEIYTLSLHDALPIWGREYSACNGTTAADTLNNGISACKRRSLRTGVSRRDTLDPSLRGWRSEEHTSELQSQFHLVCRLLLEKKKKK